MRVQHPTSNVGPFGLNCISKPTKGTGACTGRGIRTSNQYTPACRTQRTTHSQLQPATTPHPSSLHTYVHPWPLSIHCPSSSLSLHENSSLIAPILSEQFRTPSPLPPIVVRYGTNPASVSLDTTCSRSPEAKSKPASAFLSAYPNPIHGIKKRQHTIRNKRDGAAPAARTSEFGA